MPITLIAPTTITKRQRRLRPALLGYWLCGVAGGLVELLALQRSRWMRRRTRR